MIHRIKGINTVRYKDRVYYYHRASGTRVADPRTGLALEPGTVEFLLRVRELDGTAPAAPRDGTLAGLIAAYRASPEFRDNLAPRTQADYERILGWMIDSPLAELALDEITAALAIRIRDKAKRAHGRRFANYTLDVLSILCNWGIPREWTRRNPVRDGTGVPKIRRPHGMAKANRTWHEREFETVFAAAPAGLQLALALGRWGGLRVSDVIVVPWSAYDGTAIVWQQQKTGRDVYVPVRGRFKRVLDGATKQSPVIVTGTRGRPFQGTDGFRANLYKLIAGLEANGKVGPGLTFHGLRHTRGTELADGGATQRGIQAALGHTTDAATRVYTAEADSRRAATAAVLELERKPRRR